MSYTQSHGGEGILSSTDVEELTNGKGRVLQLMSDGLWHTADEICLAAGENGKPAREGLRRMRDLRNEPGLDIERERVEGTRDWRYRLVKASPEPGCLF